MPIYNRIDGEWCPSSDEATVTSHDPAAPDTVVGELQQSTVADTERAITSAQSAQTTWANTPGPERGAYLRATAGRLEKRQDSLAELLSQEEGKTLSEAAGEVQRAIDIFYYYAEKAADLGGTIKASSSDATTLSVRKAPVGVVAAITPWNYPIAIPAWKLAPALAAGNTVVFKPATNTGCIAEALVECLVESGLPDGVVNFITGRGSVVGEALATDERIDAISFTGSEGVGDVVYQNAAPNQTRVQLEMGGKNPTVVMDDADVEQAAEIVAAGAFGVTGQACTACSRAIVHEDSYDAFVETLTSKADALALGPGVDDPDMGPQSSASELEGTLEYIDIGRSEGATLETGGEVPTDDALDAGYFVEPTVFSDVDPEMRIAQEEIFGPVVAVIPVSDFEEAVDVTNGVEQGLSASIVTESLTHANRFVDETEAGVIKVNEKTTGLELHVPFGGMKGSSNELYREQGDAGLEFYTTSKTVYMNY